MHRLAATGCVAGALIALLAGCGSSSSSTSGAGIGAGIGAGASATGIGGVTIPTLPAGVGNPLGGNPLGGSGSATSSGGVPSACGLVDASTAGGVVSSAGLSKVVDQSTGFTSTCSYADTSTGASVTVSITQVPGGQVQAAMQAALQSRGSNLQSVSGIGDAAAETSNSSGNSFVVAFTKGNVFVVIGIGGGGAAAAQSRAEDLARSIAGKI